MNDQAIRFHYLTSERMTIGVLTSDSIIIQAPPIVGKFIGQPIGNLRQWMSKQPGFKEILLSNADEIKKRKRK